MLQSLKPLLDEGRKVNIVLMPAEDGGKLRLYIEPGALPKDKSAGESAAHVTPFVVCDSFEAIETGLAGAVADWLEARKPIVVGMNEAAARAKAATDAAAKKVKEAAAAKAAAAKTGASANKGKQSAAKAPAVTGTEADDEVDDEAGEGAATATATATAQPPVAAVVEEQVGTLGLF